MGGKAFNWNWKGQNNCNHNLLSNWTLEHQSPVEISCKAIHHTLWPFSNTFWWSPPGPRAGTHAEIHTVRGWIRGCSLHHTICGMTPGGNTLFVMCILSYTINGIAERLLILRSNAAYLIRKMSICCICIIWSVFLCPAICPLPQFLFSSIQF